MGGPPCAWQAHLRKEVDEYLGVDAACTSNYADASNEELMASKLLLEQMLLKMKNLREELQGRSSVQQVR